MTKTKFQISNFKFQIKNGFTLIELLVVISILGVLAGLVISNVSGVRERARDAERKSEIKTIQQALEMYKQNKTPPIYPPSASWKTDLVSGNYLAASPLDPKCSTDDCTEWVNYSYTLGSDTLTYTLIACLENASDAQKDSVKAGYCAVSSASYTRKEP